jgi:hypothetical protein
MTTYEQNRRDATKSAREISLLSRYVFGRNLRRWYLRKLIDHHLMSARAEVELARQHNETAQYFFALATQTRGALEDMEDE